MGSRNPWIEQKVAQIEADIVTIVATASEFVGRVGGGSSDVGREIEFQQRRIELLEWALDVKADTIKRRLYEMARSVPYYSLLHLRSDMVTVRSEDREALCMIELLEDALQHHEDQ
jgi:hypothetical protein